VTQAWIHLTLTTAEDNVVSSTANNNLGVYPSWCITISVVSMVGLGTAFARASVRPAGESTLLAVLETTIALSAYSSTADKNPDYNLWLITQLLLSLLLLRTLSSHTTMIPSLRSTPFSLLVLLLLSLYSLAQLIPLLHPFQTIMPWWRHH
jgi:hypothetical protein